MKLVDALSLIAKAPGENAERLKVALVCGFTPLHLQTFFQAELQQLFPARRVEIETGLYGDISGTLEKLTPTSLEAVAIVLEWPDLDARLGLRQLGGWGPSNLDSIVGRAKIWLSHLQHLVETVNKSAPVVVSLPTLPLPPLFFTAGRQASRCELELRETVASFASSISQKSKVRVLNSQRLERLSHLSERLNPKSEWAYGFPYHVSHASTLGSLLAQLVLNPPAKKGLISDLDNTLWNGIVGEIGAGAINWDLDHHSQAFGLYQQMLQSLSEEGILIAAVSKNDPAIVEEAFKRDDLLISRDSFSFLEASWGSKATAVGRILKAWNIGADSVVLIDDNPAELAEVTATHPEIECIEFPYRDATQIYELIWRLRDLFGKERISEEDQLRRQSIRANTEFRFANDESQGFSNVLLESADAHLTLNFQNNPDDKRAFELVNKTNQFNLNGKRFTEAAWRSYLADDNVFLLTVNYKDRFGPLGKIAVLAGHVFDADVTVDVWVMSCRAFARRIEHQTLISLFRRFNSNRICFAYVEQSRNRPIFSFLNEFGDTKSESTFQISRQSFEESCPKLFHRVVELDS